MANKGINKLLNKLSGGPKETPQTKLRQEQELQNKIRVQEQEFIEKLKVIKRKLSDAKSKLPYSVIKDEGYDGIVNYAINELNYAPVFDRDMKDIDLHVTTIIHHLDTAVSEGYQTTAKWASAALFKVVDVLRAPVDLAEKEYEDEVFRVRTDYANNLGLLVKCALKYDSALAEKALIDASHKRRAEEYQEKLAAYEAYKLTAEGCEAARDLQLHANDPGQLGEAGRKLKDWASDMHIMYAQVLQSRLNSDIAQADVKTAEAEIEVKKTELAVPPHAEDPLLRERLEKAHERFIEAQRKRLNNAQAMMQGLERHFTRMNELTKHGYFVDELARARKEIERIEMEKLEKARLQKEGAAAQLKMLERQRRMDAEAVRAHRQVQELQQKVEQMEEEKLAAAIEIPQETIVEEVVEEIEEEVANVNYIELYE